MKPMKMQTHYDWTDETGSAVRFGDLHRVAVGHDSLHRRVQFSGQGRESFHLVGRRGQTTIVVTIIGQSTGPLITDHSVRIAARWSVGGQQVAEVAETDCREFERIASELADEIKWLSCMARSLAMWGGR
jgi:hypothetical protein